MLSPSLPFSILTLSSLTFLAPSFLTLSLPSFFSIYLPYPVRVTTACRRCLPSAASASRCRSTGLPIT